MNDAGGGGVARRPLREEVDGQWREAAEAVGRVREGLGAGDGGASCSGIGPAAAGARAAPPPPALPLTLADAQAVVQARIEAEEKRNAKKAMGRGHGRDKDHVNVADATVGRAQLAAASPRLPWEKKEKNVFWLYVEDYLRTVTVADIERCITPYAIPVEEDAALKVGALGPHYTETWQREDAAMAVSLATTKTVAETASPQKKASASRKKLSQCSPNVRKQRTKGASTNILISPTTLKDPGKELCDCCWHGDVSEGNEILFCDNCDVAVHQWCYDVKDIPAGQWFCRSCDHVAQLRAAQPEAAATVEAPKCAVCLRGGGALAKTTSVDAAGNPRWVHIFCATTLPEMYVPDSHTDKTLFCGLDEALAERSSLTCSICKTKGGACIQCSHGQCTVAYHPLCCRDANFRIEDRIENETDTLLRVSFCPKHAKLSSLKKSIFEKEEEDKAREERVDGGDGRAASTPGVDDGGGVDRAALNGAAERAERKLGPAPSSAAAAATAAARGSADLAASDARAEILAAPVRADNAADTLREFGFGNLSLLFNQLVSLGAATDEKVAERAQVNVNDLRTWLAGGKTTDVEGVEAAVGTWLLASVDAVQKVDSPEDRVSAAAIRAALFGDPHYGDPQIIEEKVNPYILSVLDMPRSARRPTSERVARQTDDTDAFEDLDDANKESSPAAGDALPSHASGADGEARPREAEACAPASVSSAEHVRRPDDFRNEGGEVVVAPSAELLEIAPSDEILSEILYFQTQLLDVTVENRTAIFAALSALERDVPSIVADTTMWQDGTRSVEQYLEMQRESRRLLKREKREKDQQVANARLQAAALSSRAAAARGPQTFIRRHLRGRPPVLAHKLAVGSSTFNDEDVCRVCFSADSSASNMIVFCERCGTPVHQRCYSISRVPKGDWLCWPCREYEKEHGSHTRPPRWARDKGPLQNKAQCALCPIPFGAMKRDTSTNSWVHVVCAQWHPEISMRDFDASNAFMGSDVIDKSRRGLRCCICGSTAGACLTCDYEMNGVKCTSAFHPLCALEKGFDMSVIEDATGKLEYSCFCGTHSVSDGRDMDSLFKDEPVLMEKPSTVMNPNLPLAAFRSGQSILDTKMDADQHRSKGDIASMEKLRVKLERLKLLCERIVKREQIKLEITKAGRDLALNRLKNPLAASDLLLSTVFPKDGATQSALASTRGTRHQVARVGGSSPVFDGNGARRSGGALENGSRGARQQNGQLDAPSLRRGHSASGLADAAAGGSLLKKRRRGSERDGADIIQRRMTKEMADDTNTKLPEGYLYVPLSLLSRKEAAGANASDGTKR